MYTEQFKGKKIALLGLDIEGKSLINFLTKNGVEILILDEKDINYSTFQNKELIKYTSRKNVKWDKLECLIINYDDKSLIELAQKNNCSVLSITDFLIKYFSDFNYIGLIGESGISVTCFLLKYFLCKNELNKENNLSKINCCFDLNNFGENKNYIVKLDQELFNIIQCPHFNNLVVFDLDYDKLSLEKIQKMILNQDENNFTVLNLDNKEVKEFYKILKDDERVKTQLIPVSANKIMSEGISLINNEFYVNIDGESEEYLADKFTNLDGEQNKINILATLVILIKLGYNPQEVIENLHNYKSVSEVFEVVSHKENFVFINDIKNKNKSQSLISFDNIYWLLCVDDAEFELNDFVELQKYFDKIKYVFLIGKYNDAILNLFRDNDINYSIMYDMESTFEKLKTLLREEKKEEKITILLSSMNNLEDSEFYEENSEEFDKIIKKEDDNGL